jgi:hypothetical protein
MSVVRGSNNPANFYGWFDDTVSREANRKAYFSKGGNDYSALCNDAALMLDSYLQVGAGAA